MTSRYCTSQYQYETILCIRIREERNYGEKTSSKKYPDNICKMVSRKSIIQLSVRYRFRYFIAKGWFPGEYILTIDNLISGSEIAQGPHASILAHHTDIIKSFKITKSHD